MNSRQALIQITTAAGGILSPEMTGLSEVIQAADVTVDIDGHRTSHIIVRAAGPPFVVTSSMVEIRKLFPGSVVSLVLTDTPGETTIACEEVEAAIVFGAAAAAATLKRAWGWDESSGITVHIHPANMDISISAVPDGDGWMAREI